MKKWKNEKNQTKNGKIRNQKNQRKKGGLQGVLLETAQNLFFFLKKIVTNIREAIEAKKNLSHGKKK